MSIELTEVHPPRRHHVMTSGQAELQAAMEYAFNRLSPQACSHFARALRRFVDQRGPNPVPPYFLGVHDEDVTTDALLEVPQSVAPPVNVSADVSPVNVQLSHLPVDLDEDTQSPATTSFAQEGALGSSTPRTKRMPTDVLLFPPHKKNRRTRTVKQRSLLVLDGTVRFVNESGEVCGVCLRYESPASDQSIDNWIQCSGCNQWYHWDCVYTPGISEDLVCIQCSRILTVNLDESDSISPS